MEDIDNLLENYELGNPDYKPDVKKKLASMKIDRENKMQEMMKKQSEYQETLHKINMMSNPEAIQNQINQQSLMIQQLLFENNSLKEQVEYLNNKIKQLVTAQIEKRKEDKKIALKSEEPTIIYN